MKRARTDADGDRYVQLDLTHRAYYAGGGYWHIVRERHHETRPIPHGTWRSANSVRCWAARQRQGDAEKCESCGRDHRHYDFRGDV